MIRRTLILRNHHATNQKQKINNNRFLFVGFRQLCFTGAAVRATSGRR
ncbi:hypothetical protein [Serratia marcescens]|nr:hypothetical protein [Serratia marcescens]